MSRGTREKEKHIMEVLKNYSDLVENYYSGVNGVTFYRPSFILKIFKMADPIWLSS